jgi:hypothetical protein
MKLYKDYLDYDYLTWFPYSGFYSSGVSSQINLDAEGVSSVYVVIEDDWEYMCGFHYNVPTQVLKITFPNTIPIPDNKGMGRITKVRIEYYSISREREEKLNDLLNEKDSE